MSGSKRAIDMLKSFEALDSILSSSPKQQKPPTVRPDFMGKGLPVGPDITNIKVPDSLVESILAFNNVKSPEEEQREELTQPEIVSESIEEKETKLNTLVGKLSSLLKEAKVLLDEMTTSGMIGTNMKANLLKDKKKNGLVKSNKGNKGNCR